jgi:two-component system, OmpR family, sensor histidine kinase KdpD
MRDDDRPHPESFLDLESAPRKGTLRIYLGAAAGVGKTWRMLEEAHQLRARGVDLVVGLVETHGRADTAKKVGDLEVVPPRKIEYRGATFEEMDLDALLARNPEIAIVDELAHTNVPGSRHVKRWQDVEELLNAGIGVISAMNIQHVESLNPLMKRVTGVDVRETVPDAFLARAEQMVNVDVTVEALRERLREGKIYPQSQIEQALRNFFKPANLASLRELALREVARSLERRRTDLEALKREGGRRPQIAERIMVGISSNPAGSGNLLRRASRIAGELNAEWYAVHVETPSESVRRIDTADFVTLLDNINLAGDLGAETIWLKSDNVVRALIEFAREHGVSRIIVGRTRNPRWRRLLQRDVPARLVEVAREFDVEIVAGEEPEDSR